MTYSEEQSARRLRLAGQGPGGDAAAPVPPPVVGRGIPPQLEPVEIGFEVAGPQRDRIVILGRRRAGKTIYLSRLYSHMWRSTGAMHMRAISGDTHKTCMQVMQDLKEGRWPASTLGARYADIEVTFDGEKHLLVALDYPGEVFRRAFVEGAQGEDARELLDHVDRAAAVILLLDPGVMIEGRYDEAMDDEYGMVQAIHRIREWPGGEKVPIAIVFTKCDVHSEAIKAEGGLRPFLVGRYPQLVRAMGTFRVYAASAVQSVRREGKVVPDLSQSAVGIVEPLEYCLKAMVQMRRAESQAELDRLQAMSEQYEREVAEQQRKQTVIFWTLVISIGMVVLAGIGLVTWLLMQIARG